MSTNDRTAQPPARPQIADHASPEAYEIRVLGHLGTRWAAWFDGMTLTTVDDGTTVIHGPVTDQAALHGLLERLRDLGITLLSLTRLSAGATTEDADPSPTPPRTTTPGAPR